MNKPLTDLRSFLDLLKKEGELRVIDATVDPCLELAEIQRRVVKRQGPALFFTSVKDTKFPVVTNLFGTPRRIELAFGADPARFIRQVSEAVEILRDPSPRSLWKNRSMIRSLFRLGTSIKPSGSAIECSLSPPRLSVLPQIKNWPLDGGAFLTLPLVYSEHPVSGRSNLGMYRGQIFDDSTLGMHFQIHRGLGFHYYEAEERNAPLPANVFLGGPPALILAAVAPLPENIPEAVFASLLLGKKLDVIRDPKISPLLLAAESEFTFVGEIPPTIRRDEGPFGDHYGYYSLQHPFPVFNVRRMFHRRDAIFPATVVGRPRQEDHYIGDYLQELFAPLYPLVMNGVRAVWAYNDAGMHPLAAAVVSERYRYEAFMAGMRILGEGQLSLTKFLMLTDAPLPLREFRPFFQHILERADFSTDLFIFSPVSQDTLDYTGGRMNEGSKAILLGLGEKRFDLQTELTADLISLRFSNPRVYAPGILVVEGPSWLEKDGVAGDLLKEEAVLHFRVVIIVDDASECVKNDESFLWTVFTRFDPASDIYSRAVRIEKFHPRLSTPIVIDCRVKPWYPPCVLPAPETVAAVDARWSALMGGG
ncbi:MAG: UbiD family decarboxylase [Acidobacteria bacterium]|nr:UbiD family decarboxylase [Acidobacteriota bacterium]